MLSLTPRPTAWRRASIAAVLLVGLAGGVYAGREAWLTEIGEFLVTAEPPQKADIAVVLAGDGFGYRVLRAVELARQGYVPKVLVDGPLSSYDSNEAELAIGFAVRRGAPRELFIPLPMRSRSTMAEAKVVDAELLKRNMAMALVVTSDYHTRRARAIFQRLGSGHVRYVFVAARDEDFTPDGWWRTRDAQKVVFLEYAKLLDWWLRH